MNSTPLATALAQAMALFSKGQLAEAEEIAERLVKREPASSEAHDLLGLIAFQRGRRAAGVRLVESAVALSPDNAVAFGHLGVMRNVMGDLVGSVEALQRAVALAPANPTALSNLGGALVGMGESDGALAVFKRAASLAPHDARPRLNLGNLYTQRGQFEEAVHELRSLLALDTQEAGAWQVGALLGLARALLALNRPAEALDEADRAVQARPRAAEAHAARAAALAALDRPAEAITALREAVRLAPNTVNLRYDYARNLHRAGDTAGAIRECESFLAAQSGNMDMLALLAFLYNETGDARNRDRILDFSAIRAGWLAAPAGYSGVDEYIEGLVQAINAHPTLKYSPANHATRFGKHSGELFDGKASVFIALEKQIRAAIDDYANSGQLPDEAAFRRTRPARYKLAAWSVVMESQGHQIPHNHPSAWVSGVTYLQVPSAIETEAATRNGWIEFGMPPENFYPRASPHVRFFKPERGRFFLFPSYYYHRTVPFHSDTLRICVAFDAVPVA
jgi:uncharacterized protein (TIGR02466 family)